MKQIWDRIGSVFKKIFTRNGKIRAFIVPVAAMAVLLALSGVGMVQVVRTFSYNKTELSQTPEDLGITEKMDLPKGITNIALFGIDSRDEGFIGLSDSIMIMTIDAEHNDIKLTSIMRDSLVKVEGHGHQKINAAYSLGGPQLAVKTLNQTFDLNIQDYATVDFVSMIDIIDAVGGVEVELTKAEVRNANIHITSMAKERGTEKDYIQEAGVQTLNGVQAVAFSRVRKVATVTGTNNDAGRTERQRLVMRQMFEKALAMEISRYPAMIKALLPCVETSLSYTDIFGMAGILTSSGITLKEARIPTEEILISDLNDPYLGSCKYYNLDYAAKLLNAFIYEDTSFEEYIEQNGVDRTKWYTVKPVQKEPEKTEPEQEVTNEQSTAETVEPEQPVTQEPQVQEPPAEETLAPQEPQVQEPPTEETPTESPIDEIE